MLKKLICLLAIVSCCSLQSAAALEIMQPLVYEKGLVLSDWLMSEKLDGVRAYWDGKRLLSKTGKPFKPPGSFLENFPDFAVEGELWGGRGTFEKTVGIVMQKDAHIGWHDLKFALFDVPNAPGGFEERLALASRWFAAHPSAFVFIVRHQPVISDNFLNEELELIEAAGGEGIILRKSGSPYVPGRSKDVLKLKSYSDMEGVVVAHLDGEGRNAGRMGSLLVELPQDKKRFKIGSGFSEAQRDNPPPVGTVITFKYYGFYKSGIPRFPSFLHEDFIYD